MRSLSYADSGISARRAIEVAMGAARGSGWELGFFSNTGVITPVLIEGFDDPAALLMRPDGLAGQWVVDFFQDGARTGWTRGAKLLWLRTAVITADGMRIIADADLEHPGVLKPLKLEHVYCLDQARMQALHEIEERVDFMSVASRRRLDGNSSWEFTCFRAERTALGETLGIVGTVDVSGDGTEILQ